MKDPKLSLIEIKKLLDKVFLLQDLKKLNPEELEHFNYYHRNRNKFNIKQDVVSLTKNCKDGNIFIDIHGNRWKEAFLWQNKFHMPDHRYKKSRSEERFSPFFQNPDAVRYSRKFLRDDTGDLEGEFELIIHETGERIDGGNLNRVDYQESYNYGRTRNVLRHLILDVNPHNKNNKYIALKKDMGSVIINDTTTSCHPEWTTKNYLKDGSHHW